MLLILFLYRATTIPALRALVSAFGEDAVRLFQTLAEGIPICKNFFAYG